MNDTFKDCLSAALQVHTKVVNEVKKLKTADYTAWEIYANNTEIPSGAINNDLGGYVNVAIPAQMTEKFNLRSMQAYTDNDVVIDWGDGTKSYVKNGVNGNTGYTSESINSDNEYTYIFEHTYTTPGKYIIKIFGKDYFSVNHIFGSVTSPTYGSLLCRCFDADLPIASHITNLASFAFNSLRLLKLQVPSTFSIEGVTNLTHCFRKCLNLTTVAGFSSRKAWKKIDTLRAIFMDDTALATSDFNLPESVSREQGLWEAFSGCSKLTSPVSALLPANGFSSKKVGLVATFANCSSLSGGIPTNLLWNDFTKDWVTYAVPSYKTFSGCSQTLLSQIPVLWGGTLSDDVITKPYLDIDGTAKKAEKLATTRTITLAGAVTGSQTFDGSNNITIDTTLADGITIDASQVQGLTVDYNDLTNKPNLNYLPLSGGNILGNLQYKGHNLNTASGLVQLDQNGQILSSLLSSNFWNKLEVASAIASSNKLSIQTLEELPEESGGELENEVPEEYKDNVIYLVPKDENDNNYYDEYLIINRRWELIGTTKIDLSNYLKCDITNTTDGFFEFSAAGGSETKVTIDENYFKVDSWGSAGANPHIFSIHDGSLKFKKGDSDDSSLEDSIILNIASGIVLDGHTYNTPSGLVRLNENGKIPSSSIPANFTIDASQVQGLTVDYNDLLNKPDLNQYLLASTYSAQSGNFALKSELFSKNYNDLTNKPTIPTKVSDLTNDEGYLTSFTESDPVFAAQSGNFALKSELTSLISGEIDPIFSAQSSQFLTLTDFNNYVTQLSALVEDL